MDAGEAQSSVAAWDVVLSDLGESFAVEESADGLASLLALADAGLAEARFLGLAPLLWSVA